MMFKSEYYINTHLSVQELKQRLFSTFEAGDILKHDEFQDKYRNFSGVQIQSLRRTFFINDPEKHYLGSFNEVYFELKSPRFLFWKSISIYVFPEKTGASASIELNYFRSIFTLLMTLNFIGIILLFNSVTLGFLFLSVPVLLTSLATIKMINSKKYFQKKILGPSGSLD